MRQPARSPEALDHAIKEVFRLEPGLIPRLLGFDLGGLTLTFADTSIRSEEYDADHVLLVGVTGQAEAFGWHLEYQTRVDRRELGRWALKNAALNEQHERPIALIVIYLGKSRATPDAYTIEAGGWTNHHQFAAIRLCDHADRIRSGELPELAPFLILWDDNPSEETLQEELDLLKHAPLSDESRNRLIGWAVTVAARHFSNDILRSIFREELPMLKDFPEVRLWLQEERQEGRQEGRLTEAREKLERLLARRFEALSPSAREYLALRTRDELDELFDRAIAAITLAELGLPD